MIKKIILSILLVGLLVIPTFAITVEELNKAEYILTQMDNKIATLREYVQIARDGKIQGIILTATQKEELKQKYLTEKAELVTLYQQLP